MTLRGASPSTVRDAVEADDPFPGTFGFAGRTGNLLVRDVLGRVPLYVDRAPKNTDRSGSTIEAGRWWAFEPGTLTDPVLVPPGTAGRVDALATAVPTAEHAFSESVDPFDVADLFDRRWTLPDPSPAEPEPALDALADALEVAMAAVPTNGIAVAFSGGVDSALVAAFLEAPLYVIGFPDSHDVEAAQSAAAAMGRDLTIHTLTPEDLRAAIPPVANAIGRTNAMDVSIALSLYLLTRRVADDGYDRLALGQGADELFGGYEKVVHLDHRVDAATVRGAVREGIRTIPTELPRDVHAVEAAGVEPVTPLLHDRVVEAALHLPDELLATDDERKIALRTIARDYLPDHVAAREKKALQYGSLVSRELDRLARQAGYKRRQRDHVQQYIESRLATE